MGIKTTRWDSAEHLKTDEDIQLYLEACIEEAGDDPAFIVFDFSDSDQNSISERAEKQPYHPAVIAAARRRLEDAGRLINREHRLFHGEAAFASAFR